MPIDNPYLTAALLGILMNFIVFSVRLSFKEPMPEGTTLVFAACFFPYLIFAIALLEIFKRR